MGLKFPYENAIVVFFFTLTEPLLGLKYQDIYISAGALPDFNRTTFGIEKKDKKKM